MDAFVIDSRSYKCPSGLGIRAMAMGRPLVAIDTPSWAASLIRERGWEFSGRREKGRWPRSFAPGTSPVGLTIHQGRKSTQRSTVPGKACAEMFGGEKRGASQSALRHEPHDKSHLSFLSFLRVFASCAINSSFSNLK